MNVIEHLQHLDTLIIEHTKPPITAILRRELSLATEQCEAYQASSDKQDQTLERQAKMIAALQDENKKLIATIAEKDTNRKREFDDWLGEQAQKRAKLRKSYTLKHDA